MKLLFCLVLIPLFAAWNYISVAVQWCPQFCCLSPQFCRLYHHNMFVLKFLNSHCWLNMIMKSTYLPMTIHILGLSENRASIHQKMQFDREHVESQQNFRVYPWRIHGAGRKMLTWLGYIDGIHVTIYSIHGSYGICSSVDFRQIQCLLIEYLQLFAQKIDGQLNLDCSRISQLNMFDHWRVWRPGRGCCPGKSILTGQGQCFMHFGMSADETGSQNTRL